MFLETAVVLLNQFLDRTTRLAQEMETAESNKYN